MTWFEAKKKILKKIALALKKQPHFRVWNAYIENQIPGAGWEKVLKKTAELSKQVASPGIFQKMLSIKKCQAE